MTTVPRGGVHRRPGMHVFGLLAIAAVLVTAAGAVVATNGSLITIGETGNRTWLVVSNVDGSQAHPLTARPPTTGRYDESGASWSPDGTMVAFIRQVNAAESLRVVDVKGQPVLTVTEGQVSRLGHKASVHSALMWARSGRQLLFSVSERSCRTAAIIRAAIDGSSLETVWRLARTGSATSAATGRRS